MPDRPFHEFTLDKLSDTAGYDPRGKMDTMYPDHVRHKEGLRSRRFF